MTGVTNAAAAEDPVARAARLIALFCTGTEEFGRCSAVAPTDVPEVPRRLLDHHAHMTVTMEGHHGCLVTLRVVAERSDPPGERGGRYAREILLTRPDGTVVQYGIVRIDLDAVDAPTAARIRRGVEPLGRILIEAGLLCEVHDVRLLRIVPGPHLARRLGTDGGETFGRVAEIVVAGRPAIELLEIVGRLAPQ
jgi:chorismate-pyruvate lyase